MSDKLDRLEAALKAAKPSANPDRKAEILTLARKSFDAAQENATQPRPTHKSAQNVPDIWTGVKDMFRSINLRPVLYATSALCVGGLAIIITQPFTVGPMGLTDSFNEAETASLEKRQVSEKLKSKADEGAWNSTAGATVEAKVKPKKERISTLSDSLSQDASRPAVSAPAPSTIVAGKVRRVISAEEIVQPVPQQSNESFSNDAPNPLKITNQDPVSTFSIDVDTASYAYIRSSIEGGMLPPSEAVRIEEMINYFPYDYLAPDISEAPFSTSLSVFQTPWNTNTKILHIGIQGAKPEIDNRPPLNLVFLIDTSGSMQAQNKLPLLKQSFSLMLNSLRPADKVAIVTYAGSAGTVLEPTSADQKGKILESLNRLSAGGSTAGQAGLQQAYSLAEKMQSDGSIGRVLLATDGDFNVGISDPEALKKYVEDKRKTGVYLSVFGFGRGNYRDDMMQTLAQNGNGTASYIDTLAEAQKVLVDQLSGAIFPIANDVKIQIEFNPAKVAEYRLIGYETRILSREDFNNDTVDAGEIGAGHSVTALYEITPVGSSAIKNDALRYSAAELPLGSTDEYGFLKLRYKNPGESKSKLITTPISHGTQEANETARFAAAIAGFGQLLTDEKYLNGWTWDKNIALALSGKGSDQFGYRAEAIQLMRLAKSLN